MVSDIDPNRVSRVVEELSAEAIDVEAIYDVDADVYAPCALGATITDETIGRLQAPIVAGAWLSLDTGKRSTTAASCTRPTTSSTRVASSTCTGS